MTGCYVWCPGSSAPGQGRAEPQLCDDSWYAWTTATGRRPARLTSRPCALAQERIASAWPAGAMVAIAFIDPMRLARSRPDGLAAAVARLAGSSSLRARRKLALLDWGRWLRMRWRVRPWECCCDDRRR